MIFLLFVNNYLYTKFRFFLLIYYWIYFLDFFLLVIYYWIITCYPNVKFRWKWATEQTWFDQTLDITNLIWWLTIVREILSWFINPFTEPITTIFNRSPNHVFGLISLNKDWDNCFMRSSLTSEILVKGLIKSTVVYICGESVPQFFFSFVKKRFS